MVAAVDSSNSGAHFYSTVARNQKSANAIVCVTHKRYMRVLHATWLELAIFRSFFLVIGREMYIKLY